jgi:hypothetical protein
VARAGDAEVRVRNCAGVRVNPAIATLVWEAALASGMAPAAADELRMACRVLFYLITDAVDPEAAGDLFEVSVHRHHEAVIVRVDDRGLPYELADVEQRFGEATIVGVPADDVMPFLHRLLDEVHFESRGRQGNRIELVKRLRDAATIPKRTESTAADAVDPSEPVDVRPMTADDAIAFARDVYRSYGYSYASDWAYRADVIDEQLQSGVLHGWVGECCGCVVGHICIRRDPPDARFGEAGLAMIEPRFRHQNLGGRLGLAMSTWAYEQGLLGIFGEATTIHPFSQRASLKGGGHELAIMVGYIPAMSYEGIGETGRRIAAALVLLKLRPLPVRAVHAPARHREILRRIYAINQLEGDFVDGAAEPRRPTGDSRFSLRARADYDLAIIDVHRPGADLGDVAAERLRRLRGGAVRVIHADLPLSAPETPAACGVLEGLGFFFAGVAAVDDDQGYRLRLQYLNDVEVVPEDIKVASDFGRELRDYVLAARPDD